MSEPDDLSDIEDAVRRVLARELADGRDKRSNSHWSSNGHNVGSDVIAAVVAARTALRAATEASPTITLAGALQRIADAHEVFRITEEDPDGFGSATFHGIRRDLESLIAKHAPDATLRPDRV